jgi:hypothetical protein
LQTYITHYYKGLFGPHECVGFSLDENRRNDIPQISTKDNAKLTTIFTEKEVIFQMKRNKAYRVPMGFL